MNTTIEHTRLPNRLVLHAVEGWGKTSFGTQVPGAVFLTTTGEDGLDTLATNGQIQPTPHFPPATIANDLRSAINELIVEEHAYRCLVIDTLNGAERLYQTELCRLKYRGDWGEKGFSAWQRGYEETVHEWIKLLDDLDRLRLRRNMSILLLAHTRAESFRNPDGPDYDRWAPALHKRTWDATQQWADLVLFGSIQTFVATERQAKKGKAQSNGNRQLTCERSGSVVAKNRHGLPATIECGTSAAQAWQAFYTAITQPKENHK